METMENIDTRRSIRVYQDTPIPQKVLEAVLSAALMAPSWKNTQTAGYILARPDSPLWDSILECLPSYNRKTASTAQALVIMTTKKARCGYERDGSFTTKKEDRWEMFDAGIAAQTLCLAAWEQNLGSCIMGIYDEDRLPEILHIPNDQYITALISLGYPAESPNAPKRKTLEEKVRYV